MRPNASATDDDAGPRAHADTRAAKATYDPEEPRVTAGQDDAGLATTGGLHDALHRVGPAHGARSDLDALAVAHAVDRRQVAPATDDQHR